MRGFLDIRVCLTLLVPALVLGTFLRRANAVCVGDCNEDNAVTVDELIDMVDIALGNVSLSPCPAGDTDSSGDLTVDEVIAGVNSVLSGCPLPNATATPTPTFTPTPTSTSTPLLTPTFSVASTFPQLQSTIFNPTCLDLSCHNAKDKGGSLVLEGSVAYTNLVGPPPPTPSNLAAHQAGMLRVDPGNPDNSFLMTKVTLAKAFDLKFGSRMPSGKPVLTADQIDNIRAWILRGALADESPPSP